MTRGIYMSGYCLCAIDVGLLLEDYDLGTNRLLGNFPQAFSHVAMINTAYLLTSQTEYRRHETGRLAPELIPSFQMNISSRL